jgi:hypothetical protein
MVPERMWCSGHPRLGRQQAHGDLGLAHLEREDRARQAVLDRGARAMSSPSVDLPEPGPAGDDDELAGVQAVRQPVEVDEAGGDARHRAAAAADGLELVHRRLHELLEQRVVLDDRRSVTS